MADRPPRPASGPAVDVLIVGSGIAGLRTALALAERHRVLVVTKKQVFESNTNYAQGGIASVLDESDDFDLHIQDTLRAGAGLCHPAVVRRVVEAGPAMIEDLRQLGIRFSQQGGRFELGREGGHSRRRIVHAGDFTGRELESALCAAVQDHPNIAVLENHLAVDLRRDEHGEAVCGVWVLDRTSGRALAFDARVTLLASGGSGKVYRYTSNPDIATGDGLAMAYRAGATVANLEFFQFHPTCLFHPLAKNFLISEAVRGEGAILRNLDGDAFMARYHEMADLAPRDIVARAIDQEMKARGEDYVLLDSTHLDAARFEQRFPNITARCREFDLDPTRAPLPVVPAAHYQCGGVVVDQHGASDVGGLFVIGEAASTGLHGANRLASNSLLEALVFSHAAVERIDDVLAQDPGPRRSTTPWEFGAGEIPKALLRHDWEIARRTMWDYVGIFRDLDRLRVARQRMASLRRDAETWCATASDPDLFELRNVTLLGELSARCAHFRRESRGLHALADEPNARDEFLGDTWLRSGGDPHLQPIARASEAHP